MLVSRITVDTICSCIIRNLFLNTILLVSLFGRNPSARVSRAMFAPLFRCMPVLVASADVQHRIGIIGLVQYFTMHYRSQTESARILQSSPELRTLTFTSGGGHPYR